MPCRRAGTLRRTRGRRPLADSEEGQALVCGTHPFMSLCTVCWAFRPPWAARMPCRAWRTGSRACTAMQGLLSQAHSSRVCYISNNIYNAASISLVHSRIMRCMQVHSQLPAAQVEYVCAAAASRAELLTQLRICISLTSRGPGPRKSEIPPSYCYTQVSAPTALLSACAFSFDISRKLHAGLRTTQPAHGRKAGHSMGHCLLAEAFTHPLLPPEL